MPEKVSIFVEGAPSAYGHFAQAIKLGDTVHISGQLPIDAQTNKLVAPDAATQARTVFNYLTAIMQSCGGQLSNVLSMRLYLIDLRDHAEVDKISREFFFFIPPARTVVAVAALPFGARVCIDATAQLTTSEIPGAAASRRI
jgi:reactive intermediate/imine deaminase